MPVNDRFDAAFRKRLLMALCADPDFFRKAIDFLKPEMILERPIQFAYSVILRCYAREGRLPTPEVLQMAAMDDLHNPDILFELKPSEEELDAYADTVGLACVGLTNQTSDQTAYMSAKLKDFLQMVYMAAIPSEATQAQRLEMYSQIYAQMQSYDHTESVNEQTLDEALAKMNETVDIRNRIGTGLSTVDVPLNGGLAPGEIGLIVAPSGTGKAVPNYTVIPTPDGFRRVGDIRVGDRLFGSDGKPTTVTDVFPQDGLKEVYEICFSDGRKAECCGDHLWEVYGLGHTRACKRVVTANTLFERFKVAGKNGVYVPTCEPVEYENKALTIHPYIVGALIGNGCLTCKCLTVSSGDTFVTHKIESLLGSGYKFIRYTDKNYNYLLKKDGHLVYTADFLSSVEELMRKSSDKRIPAAYLTGSISQRKELLQGLLDTDGSAGEKGRLSYSTTSKGLVADIVSLCRSLGLIATYGSYDRSADGKKSIEYEIHIQASSETKASLVTHPKKKSRLDAWSRQNRRTMPRKRNRIVSIVKTGRKTEMTCFKVDAQDHLWLMNDYIVTHNSNAMINFACENILRGNESFYVTLELSKPVVLARSIAIFTGIRASKIFKGTSEKAQEAWTESERKRFHDLVDKDGCNRHLLESLKIIEHTDKHVTPDSLKQEIIKWKEERIKQGIQEDRLGFVAIDWLRNIDPSTISGVNKNLNQAAVMEYIVESLRQAGVATETRVWTAQQAARNALNKEVLTMQDGRDSSGTFNPVDIAMGLTIKKEVGSKGAPVVKIADEKTKVKLDPDRDMVWSIMKDRNSGATGTSIKFYQGPSLKFYESKKECQRADLLNLGGRA